MTLGLGSDTTTTVLTGSNTASIRSSDTVTIPDPRLWWDIYWQTTRRQSSLPRKPNNKHARSVLQPDLAWPLAWKTANKFDLPASCSLCVGGGHHESPLCLLVGYFVNQLRVRCDWWPQHSLLYITVILGAIYQMGTELTEDCGKRGYDVSFWFFDFDFEIVKKKTVIISSFSLFHLILSTTGLFPGLLEGPYILLYEGSFIHCLYSVDVTVSQRPCLHSSVGITVSRYA